MLFRSALRLGERLGITDAPRLFNYPTAESVFNEHRETTRGRDLDITGLSYTLLETRGPQQWPFPEGATTGKARLYEDGMFVTPSGRARFVNTVHKPVAEKTDARYPLHLNTGRLRDQWHGMSRSGRVARLANHAEEPLLALNASDMALRGLADGDVVSLRSRRGAITVRVAANDEISSGNAYMPMHWGGRSLNSAGVNALTVPTLDPLSKQPELKHAAVEIARLNLPFRVVAMKRFTADEGDAALALLDDARELLSAFDHATLGLAGRDHMLVVLRGYHVVAVPDAVLDRIDALFGIAGDKAMRYVDARKRVEKKACLTDGVVTSVCLAGETAAQEWLKNMMIEGASAEAVRPWILAPVASAPRGSLARGRIVCACHDVSESDIRNEAHTGLVAVQAKLKCGTQCGSCLPAVKRLVADNVRVAA